MKVCHRTWLNWGHRSCFLILNSTKILSYYSILYATACSITPEQQCAHPLSSHIKYCIYQWSLFKQIISFLLEELLFVHWPVILFKDYLQHIPFSVFPLPSFLSCFFCSFIYLFLFFPFFTFTVIFKNCSMIEFKQTCMQCFRYKRNVNIRSNI